MQRLIALTLAVLMAVSIGCGESTKGGAAKTKSTPADAKSLNFTLSDVNNQPVDMRNMLGKVVIVDFWDTWCGPCRKEIPHFVELYHEYNDDGLEIVGVAFARNGLEAVKKFGDEYKINYTNGIMNDEAAKIFGRPPSIPTTFIINQNGEIHEKIVGFRPKEYFEGKIKELLKLS
jgi:thiol-disulfide isomerase/thioredoxin